MPPTGWASSTASPAPWPTSTSTSWGRGCRRSARRWSTRFSCGPATVPRSPTPGCWPRPSAPCCTRSTPRPDLGPGHRRRARFQARPEARPGQSVLVVVALEAELVDAGEAPARGVDAPHVEHRWGRQDVPPLAPPVHRDAHELVVGPEAEVVVDVPVGQPGDVGGDVAEVVAQAPHF